MCGIVDGGLVPYASGSVVPLPGTIRVGIVGLALALWWHVALLHRDELGISLEASLALDSDGSCDYDCEDGWANRDEAMMSEFD